MKKLALFTSHATMLNTILFFAIKRGFESLGVEVAGGPVALPDDVMAAFCREFQPDAVLEFDRTRHHLPSLPRHIPHIAWILDLVNRHGHRFYGSEILYGIGADWFHGDPVPYGAQRLGWLPPGYCPHTYYYEEPPWESDFSFVGHIPDPWSAAEKARPLCRHGGPATTFGAFVGPYLERLVETCRGLPSHPYMDWPEGGTALLDAALKEMGCTKEEMGQSLYYDLSIRIVRMHNRLRFFEKAMTVSDAIRFFGTGGWSKWPQFAGHFQGYAHGEQARRVYQTSRINLHEGTINHFRLLDCLASGGFLFYRQQPFLGIRNVSLLQEGVHYLAVGEGEFAEKSRYYLDHPEERRRMARLAAAEVAAHHAWHHRAAMVVQDWQRLRGD